MQAAVVTEFGKRPRYLEFRDPVPQQDEVLVHVTAAGLHPLAKALASGTHYASSRELPAVAGVDGVGRLEDGRRVYFLFSRNPWGTMAELAPAKRSMCVPVPDGLDDLQAAAIVNPGLSAWMSLHDRAGLDRGESVVILGATGVAGQLAIQSARLLGARRVVAVGRNVDALNGADVDRILCLNDSESAVRDAFLEEAAAGVDVVADYLWGNVAEWLLEALAKQFNPTVTRRTRWVQVGDRAGKAITLQGGTLRSIDLHLTGSGFGANSMEQILATVPVLFQKAVEGKLQVSTVTSRLKEVESAWDGMAKGQRIVVLI
jgi:NADPH:quinone reductase-like Zn-dependent oxidoreductase